MSQSMPSIDIAQRRRDELRGVIAMTVPMVVTNCTRMIMDVTDFAMVSRLPDTAAQAAMLPGQMIVWAHIVIGLGIVSIVATFASQSLGRERYADCSAYAWQGLYLSAFFAVLALSAFYTAPQIIRLIGHESAVQTMEMAYINAALWSVGPTLAAWALSSFFNGVHLPRITMWSAIEGIVVNMAVSYALIFGKFGLPALGIAGAAWGTVVATSYRALRLTVTLCMPEMNRRFHGRSTWRLDIGKCRAVLRIGIPQGAQWLSDVVVWAIFVNVLIGKTFGTAHLTATGVVWQYVRMSLLPIIGLGMGLGAMVGKAIGQGDPERAIRETRVGILISLAYMGMFTIVFILWRRSLIGFFNTDPEIVAIGSTILICMAVFQTFDGAGMVYAAALRGAGDTWWPSTFLVVSHWVILIAGGTLTVIFYPQYGSIGPWVVATCLLVLVGVALWWRWHTRKWMTIDIFKHEKAADAAGAAQSAADQASQEQASSPPTMKNVVLGGGSKE